MSVLENRVRRGFYLDSVALMRVSRTLSELAGVEAAALMIGSPANKSLLETSSLLAGNGAEAGVNDLIIAVRSRDAASMEHALEQAEALLVIKPATPASSSTMPRARRLASALTQLDGANLALISVPGEFAAREARQALARGLNVVMFSDNVPIEEEIALKRLAQERGLLMMGPDCGTCFIGGIPIAFANAVSRGNIGIVAASGTGLQEVATLIARGGAGIAHGIGVGGRDLSAEVGGIATLAAIDALDADAQVERIALISKPPASTVIDRVLTRIGASRKPFVICFIGCGDIAVPANAVLAPTLRAAAERCLEHAIAPQWTRAALADAHPREGTIRGLFCGGTLCAESQTIALANGLRVSSNTPVPGAQLWTGVAPGHQVMLDLGDDDYTRGRPHPMIEPAIRSDSIVQALHDSRIGVLLLDVVIGFGAHRDPAGIVAAALAQCSDRKSVVVASVTGTEQDPQCHSAQQQILQHAGVIVAPSNAHAAELAVAIVSR